MKILIGYPPTESHKGVATLGQNRQFQWFSNPSMLFPVIPASAATLLRKNGHVVTWLDCVASSISKQDFFEKLASISPDIFVFETKTPVIRQHWQIIDEIKNRFPAIKIALMGDHVTSFPEESMENSKVDYVLCGGHYDFALGELIKAIQSGSNMPPGVFHRRNTEICGDKNFITCHDLDSLPFIDRELVNWRLYQKEYNFAERPYFYIMSSRDCWWGKCTFCSWPRMYPKFNCRSVGNVLDEVGVLLEQYRAREIFDDAGTLNTGEWLTNLCNGLIERQYNRKIKYSCNMRFGALKQKDYKLMKAAGFRLLKFGLESASQATLDRLQKGIKVSDIWDGCEMAHQAGLTVHLTMIVGYPWETREDAMRTFELAKKLMQSGRADLLQATVLVPYPGTPIWQEAQKQNQFLFNPHEYDRYDMREPVLKTKDADARETANICGKIYMIFLTPSYIMSRLKSLNSLYNLKLNVQGVKAVAGHLKDFMLQR